AAAVADADPEKAALLLLQTGQAAWVAGDVAATAEAGQRLGTLAVPEDTPARLVGRVLVGLAGLMTGDTSQAAPLLRGVAARAQTAGTPLHLGFAGSAAMFAGDDAVAADLLGRAGAAAGGVGAVGTVPGLLQLLAYFQAWTSGWPLAAASASEGLRLATETGQDNAAAYHHAVLAWVAAAQGREQACRAHATAALQQAARRALALQAGIATWALGLAQLSGGPPAAALAQLERFGTPRPGRSHPLPGTF